MRIRYWQEDLEKIDRKSLAEIQLKLLKQTITQALKTPFYSQRLKKAGISSPEDITALEDLHKIPFTTKDDLRDAYPFGLLAVELKDVVRIHTSSGTTGKPTVIYHTRNDIDNWANLVARCIVMTGCGREDVFQNMMSYGLFTGGLG
ncbi:MAG: phenylacetate--CoA ligase, partial [Candidatus Omnitrophica bacterium]|nr:phenylacetate--CoA ligase [Candidatus Omnitrophota bacterium]